MYRRGQHHIYGKLPESHEQQFRAGEEPYLLLNVDTYFEAGLGSFFAEKSGVSIR